MSVWRRALLRAANAGRAALEVRDVPAAAFHHHRACACACALSPILRDHPWPSRWAGSSAAASLEDVRGELERMNELFAVARDEIELAMEDKDTVYFEEGYREAKRCTEEVIRCWEGVLARLREEDRAQLLRSTGLKIEQLKAEMGQLDQMLHE